MCMAISIPIYIKSIYTSIPALGCPKRRHLCVWPSRFLSTSIRIDFLSLTPKSLLLGAPRKDIYMYAYLFLCLHQYHSSHGCPKRRHLYVCMSLSLPTPISLLMGAPRADIYAYAYLYLYPYLCTCRFFLDQHLVSWVPQAKIFICIAIPI